MTKGSALDKCAEERVNSKYIGKAFFKSMLPRAIYSNIGSLKATGTTQKDDSFVLNSPKHALSLFLYINGEGLVVYKEEARKDEQPGTSLGDEPGAEDGQSQNQFMVEY